MSPSNRSDSLFRETRSRSRLPDFNLTPPLNSPLKSYRDRSSDRSAEKLHKSTLYKKENVSHQDLPLLNSSYNNKINQPEFQQEQDSRGRARGRDSDENASANDDLGSDPNDMISLMGFAGFGSTKGKHVKGTKGGTAKHDKQTEYRQYMNRSKGFNRPLSPNRKDN